MELGSGFAHVAQQFPKHLFGLGQVPLGEVLGLQPYATGLPLGVAHQRIRLLDGLLDDVGLGDQLVRALFGLGKNTASGLIRPRDVCLALTDHPARRPQLLWQLLLDPGKVVEHLLLADHDAVGQRDLAGILDVDHQLFEHVEHLAGQWRRRLIVLGGFDGHPARSFNAVATTSGTRESTEPPKLETSLTRDDERYPYSGLVATNIVSIPDR